MADELVVNCGGNVQDLLDLLASCLVKDSNGKWYLKINLTTLSCSNSDPAIECGDNLSAEEALKNIIRTDCDEGSNRIELAYEAQE